MFLCSIKTEMFTVAVACSRRSDSGERCEVKKSAEKKGEGEGEVREVPAPLSPAPLYFSSLSLLRTAFQYLNAWNRLLLLNRKRFSSCKRQDRIASCKRLLDGFARYLSAICSSKPCLFSSNISFNAS